MDEAVSMLADRIEPGDHVWWQQGPSEAITLVDGLLRLCEERAGEEPVHAFSGLSLNPRFGEPLPAGIDLTSYGAMGTLRSAAGAGRLGIVPCHYSAVPRLFAHRRLGADVALLQVSAPDDTGQVSFGVSADYGADLLKNSRLLLAEVNHAVPFNPHATTLPLASLDAYIESHRPLPENSVRTPDAVDLAIAGSIAELIPNGSTIQAGVGSLPNAIYGALHGHRELGIHSGVIADPILDLIDAGVITNGRKEIDRGVSVGAMALGHRALYESLPHRSSIRFRETTYTHNSAVLSRLGSLVAVNAALQVDLNGQVNAEMVDGRYLGGIGGQADFARAASATGTLSIIALRSTSRSGSTVVPALSGGLVATGRPDVDVVVTENGIADLRGLTHSQRATALIGIAAPEHCESLHSALGEQHRPSLARTPRPAMSSHRS